MFLLKIFLFLYLIDFVQLNDKIEKCGKYPIESLQTTIQYESYKNGKPKVVKTSGQVDFEGSFGKVSIGFLIGKNGLRCVAVKILKKNDENKQYYKKSIGVAEKIEECLERKRRRHLIEMIDAGVENQNLLIIMELGDDTFHDRLYNRTESYENDLDWMQAIANLAQPLKEFHQVAIHMDIKATNYLYVPKNGQMLLKLIDFDGSQLIDYSNKNAAITAVGWVYTTQYCAPEFYGRDTQISRKFDIWSLGMVIFEIFVDKLRQQHGIESLNLDNLSRFLIDIGDLYAKFKQGHVNRTLRRPAIPYLELKDWSYTSVIDVVLQFWLKYPKTALLVTNMLHPIRQKRMTAKGILEYKNGLCHIREFKFVQKPKNLRIFSNINFGNLRAKIAYNQRLIRFNIWKKNRKQLRIKYSKMKKSLKEIMNNLQEAINESRKDWKLPCCEAE